MKRKGNDGMKRTGKNYLERELADVRRRVSQLPEVARREGFGMTYAHVLYLRDKFDEIAAELYRIEHQEELWIDASASKNAD